MMMPKFDPTVYDAFRAGGVKEDLARKAASHLLTVEDREFLATKADLADLRSEFAQLRSEFTQLRSDLRADGATLRGDILKLMMDQNRWILAWILSAMVGLTAIFGVMLRFFK